VGERKGEVNLERRSRQGRAGGKSNGEKTCEQRKKRKKGGKFSGVQDGEKHVGVSDEVRGGAVGMHYLIRTTSRGIMRGDWSEKARKSASSTLILSLARA